jgi:hypothetical protein
MRHSNSKAGAGKAGSVPRDLRAEVLGRLDIIAHYESLGVHFITREPNDEGYVKCRADDDDKNPSASVYVGPDPKRKGRFYDFRDKKGKSLFDFTAEHAPHKYGREFEEVLHALEKEVGLDKGASAAEANGRPAGNPGNPPPPKDPPAAQAKKRKSLPLEFYQWSDRAAADFCDKKKPTTPDAIKAAGGRLAKFPRWGDDRQYVFAFPTLDAAGRELGWHVARVDGEMVRVTKDGVTTVSKTVTFVASGWLNLAGVKKLASAAVVFKCEGLSDALALQAVAPDDVAVIATTGAGDKPDDDDVAALTGKTVFLVHDTDKAGRDGARPWVLALEGKAASVREVRLPNEGDAGKVDVRDFLAGHTYAELLKLAEATPEGVQSEPWGEPEMLDAPAVPPFPVDVLPEWQRDWVKAKAVETQTPPDMAAVLVLTVTAAALARRFEVQIRPGWREPTNLYSATAMESGERKSAVFRDATAPVGDHERDECERLGPEIAKAASDHEVLAQQLKKLQTEAAKAKGAALQAQAKGTAREKAKELAAHVVPAVPQFLCDDATPESLPGLLADNGERLLQASDEGTPFEIAKGRYSENGPRLEVYLKSYSGDRLRVNRVKRAKEFLERPALSVALAVQPHVIAGLGEEADVIRRGFLSRFLFSVPESFVGRRVSAADPVPPDVAEIYRQAMLALWKLEGGKDDKGRPVPHLLHFSPEANALMKAFEDWREPLLARGDELSGLYEWPKKMSGAAARIAAALHMAGAVKASAAGADELPDGTSTVNWNATIDADTVEKAIRLVKDYFLPHALAAFDLMGANEVLEKAKTVWANIVRRRGVFALSAHFAQGGTGFTQRDLYMCNRSLFKGGMEELKPVVDALVERNLIRKKDLPKQTGPGRPSVVFEANPAALEASRTRTP